MRIVLADDSVLLREGLTLLLGDACHEVVAGVADGPAMVAAALEHRPDLVITDIRMPPSHTDEGLRAAVELRRTWPQARVLVLSQYVVQSYARELLESGSAGTGYLLKDRVSDVAAFHEAVDRVASGGTAIDPEVIAQLLRRPDDRLADLTPREREVLAAMAQGHSNAAVASELVISEGAVEKHTQRIFAKLGLHHDPQGHRRVRAVLTYLGM